MSFKLNQVVPWGRSYAEYCSMFSLTADDLSKRILGCGDGPASFNAELTQKGGRVISVDPVYQLTTKQIKKRIDETAETIAFQVAENRSDFVWGNAFSNPEDLLQKRLQTMGLFLSDFERGKEQGRYLSASLPDLPFSKNTFDLVLVSHFLFLYSDILDADFHLTSIINLLKLAPEIRIFPILELNGATSRHFESIIDQLADLKVRCSIKPVEYEFQKGGTRMLVIKHSFN